MHTKQGPSREQRGQAIVLVALMALVLVAFVGLALDGGQVYSWRRGMQNAADAGAVAGAYSMTLGANNAQIGAAVQQYSVGANRADLYDFNVQSNCVTVSTTKNFSSLFVGLIGISSLDAKARATACAGQPIGAGNLWPLLVPTSSYTINSSYPVTLSNYAWADFGNTSGNIDPVEMGIGYTGQFVTWPVGVSPVCNIGTANPASSQIIPPTCVHLKSGQSNQTQQILDNVCPHALNHDTFLVPLYDACLLLPCKPQNGEYFRVVGFGRFELTGYQINNGNWCGKAQGLPPPGCPDPNNGCIIGKFVTYVGYNDICVSGCAPYSGTLSVILTN